MKMVMLENQAQRRRAIEPNVWCFAKAGLRRTNVELTTKDN
jgi:hypothetical protein